MYDLLIPVFRYVNLYLAIMKSHILRFLFCSLLTVSFCKISYAINAPTLQSPLSGNTINGFEAFLQLNAVTGASGYQFQYDTSATFSSSHLRSDTSSKTYISTKALHMGKKYYWRARAFKPGDTSVWSGVFNYTVYTKCELGFPANNTTGNVRFMTCYIAASYLTITYFFEADSTPLFNSPLHVFTNSTTSGFIDTALSQFGNTIYWRARATNGIGDTLQWSDTWAYTIIKKPEFSGNLSNVAPQVRITWPTLIYDFNETIFQVDTAPSFNSPILAQRILPRTISADTLRNLKFGGKYYCRIRSKFGNNLSEWSDSRIITVTTNGGINSPAQGAIINSLTGTFTWNRLDGADVQFQLCKDSAYTQLIKDSLLYSSSGFYGNDTLSFNKKYYMRIRYFHAKDTTPWINRNFQVYGGSIVLVSPYLNSKNQDVRPRFTFQRETWAHSYLLLIDTGLTFPQVPSSYRISITKFTYDMLGNVFADTSLRYGQNYSWRVYAVKGADTSDASYPFTFQTKAAPALYFPPNDFIGIGTATNGLITGINGSTLVQWELDTSVLFNSAEHLTGVGPHIPDDLTPAYVDVDFPSDLFFDSKYYWRVRCINAFDTSDWSTHFNFVTTTVTRLTEPVNNAINLEPSVTLKWSIQGSSSDYIYQYQLSKSAAFTDAPVMSLPADESPEITITCDYETRYYWRTRAKHSRDTSIWSGVFSFTIKNAPLVTPPTLFSPPNKVTNLPVEPVVLEWSTLAEVSSYEVEVASDSAFNIGLTRSSTQATALSFSRIQASWRYYWRVRGHFNNIIGPWSKVWWFETINLSGLNETDDAIRLLIRPNPAEDIVTITSAKEGAVLVYNSTGVCIFKDEAPSSQRNVDTHNWSSGIYFVMIRTKEGQSVKRLVIK